MDYFIIIFFFLSLDNFNIGKNSIVWEFKKKCFGWGGGGGGVLHYVFKILKEELL